MALLIATWLLFIGLIIFFIIVWFEPHPIKWLRRRRRLRRINTSIDYSNGHDLTCKTSYIETKKGIKVIDLKYY